MLESLPCIRQTGSFFFFASPPPSDAVRKGWGGHAGASWSSQAVQLWGQQARSGSELLLELSEIPGKRVKGGTLAESLPIEFSRMLASISLALFSLMFCSVLHWTESGGEGEIAQGQYLDELLVSQVALYKLATAP